MHELFELKYSVKWFQRNSYINVLIELRCRSVLIGGREGIPQSREAIKVRITDFVIR